MTGPKSENAGHAGHVDADVLQQSHDSIRALLTTVAAEVHIDIVDDYLRADDATAYLAHLAARYHSPPRPMRLDHQ